MNDFSKLNILFCTEKFCDGKPEMGLTNSYHNVFGSLKHSGIKVKDFNIIHLDEATVNYNTHIDKLLPKAIAKYNPNVIIHLFLGKSPMNPSFDMLKEIKNKGIYQCVIFPDTGFDWGHNTIIELKDVIDLNVSWDNAFNYPEQHSNHIWLWTSQDDKLYHKGPIQDIQCSFIGSVNTQERQEYLSYALSKGAPIMVRGGQRNEKLSPEQYANLMRRSKICLNFPASAGSFHQAKGRVYEALASGCLILERKNDFTSRVIKPGIEYAEYDSPQDLVDKIKYYLEHEDERLKIANAGWQAYQDRFHSSHYWTKFFNYVMSDLNFKLKNA